MVGPAFMWGLLSAVSLNIGSFIGVTCLPTQKVRAVLMSFGGGALLFALTIELFGNVLAASQDVNATLPVWIMEGGAILGGLFFAVLNYLLNQMGADIRKPATAKGRLARLRELLMNRLARRLLRVPFFSSLSVSELGDLIHAAMYKERFQAGHVIMSGELGDHHAIYFILSGRVKVQLRGADSKKLKEAMRPVLKASGSATFGKLSLPVVSRLHADPPMETQPIVMPDDDEVQEWFLGPNQIFGDMTILTGAYVQATAEAVTPVKVLVLPGHEVMHLLELSTNVRQQVATRAIKRLCELAEVELMTDEMICLLAARCDFRTFKKCDVVYDDAVCDSTPILELVLGSVEVSHDRAEPVETVHAGELLCGSRSRRSAEASRMVAKALTPVCTLTICRSAIKEVMDQAQEVMDQAPKAHKRKSGFLKFAGSLVPGQVTEVCPFDDTTASVPSEVAEISQSESTGVPPRRLANGTPLKQSKMAGQDSADLPHHTRAWEDDAADKLGWSSQGGTEDDLDHSTVPLGLQISRNPFTFGQVTDHDLVEHETCLTSVRRSVSKQSGPATSSVAPVAAVEGDCTGKAGTMLDLEDGGHGQHGHHDFQAAKNRAIMVWLGILIDACPESLVIGIIVNRSAVGAAEGENLHVRAAATVLPFVIGVFISNLPESMGSAGSMKAHGMKVPTILAMWLATTVLTACGSAIGAAAFPAHDAGGIESANSLIVNGVEGLAAGAMLTMIAQTMMPEAFEQGGDIVGLSCLAGFLCALSVKPLPIGSPAAH